MSNRIGVNLIADAHYLPLRGKIVDKTLCRSVLEHVESPLNALLEMKRITIGSIMVIVPNIMNIKRILRTLINPLYEIPSSTRHLQAWDSKEVRNLASLSGLVTVSITWNPNLLFSRSMIAIFRSESG